MTVQFNNYDALPKVGTIEVFDDRRDMNFISDIIRLPSEESFQGKEMPQSHLEIPRESQSQFGIPEPQSQFGIQREPILGMTSTLKIPGHLQKGGKEKEQVKEKIIINNK